MACLSSHPKFVKTQQIEVEYYLCPFVPSYLHLPDLSLESVHVVTILFYVVRSIKDELHHLKILQKIY